MLYKCFLDLPHNTDTSHSLGCDFFKAEIGLPMKLYINLFLLCLQEVILSM
jgi:hypothetical protein